MTTNISHGAKPIARPHGPGGSRTAFRLSSGKVVLVMVTVAVAVLMITIYFHALTFFRVNNLINVLVQASIVGILAIG